jgi:hypothetical protein
VTGPLHLFNTVRYSQRFVVVDAQHPRNGITASDLYSSCGTQKGVMIIGVR